jgi:hypothetical protein
MKSHRVLIVCTEFQLSFFNQCTILSMLFGQELRLFSTSFVITLFLIKFSSYKSLFGELACNIPRYTKFFGPITKNMLYNTLLDANSNNENSKWLSFAKKIIHKLLVPSRNVRFLLFASGNGLRFSACSNHRTPPRTVVLLSNQGSP